jgi:hypothetical protein
VLASFSRFVAPNGKLITQIPNMSGLLGSLTKLMNRAVYDIHVPHDRHSFRGGHLGANLNVTSCDYVGSSNFGILSSCVRPESRLKWQIYLWLSRLSKMGFLVERKFGDLPTTKMFSPYILAVAERR